jgi:membrane fusion protein (multidrug efflux system)
MAIKQPLVGARMRHFLILLLLVCLSACGEDQSAQGQDPGAGGMPPTMVDVYQVTSRESNNSLQAIGNLRAIESVIVRPEVAGKLVRINALEGQAVTAGAVLFVFDDGIARADYNEAMANLRASQRNRPRIIELATKQLISRADADSALNVFEVNVAKVASAKARLDKSIIRAPFDGVIGLRQVSIGEFANAGQALVELVRLNPLQVEFQVSELHISRLQTGQTVTVKTDAFPGDTFAGAISAIAPSIQMSGRSAVVRARLDNNDKKLVPGQFAQVQVELSKSEPVLMIPEQAVWPSGDQKMAFVVKDGKAQLVPITLGAREPGWVIVVSGLKAGEQVITAGQSKLFPGAAVMIAKPTASSP